MIYHLNNLNLVFIVLMMTLIAIKSFFSPPVRHTLRGGYLPIRINAKSCSTMNIAHFHLNMMSDGVQRPLRRLLTTKKPSRSSGSDNSSNKRVSDTFKVDNDKKTLRDKSNKSDR